MAQFILTAVGADRPGLVGELTGHLHGAGANILDTRMVNLRGRFAVIMLMELGDPGPIKQVLPALEAIGLTVQLTDHSAGTAAKGGLPFRLKTYSLDQPGLVHRISEVLRRHGVNIEDLSARQESAPFAGDPLFTMEMRLTVPPAVAVRALRADLDGVCEKVNADIDLEPG
ncbi:MAG TPA: ACT domain-containing protein [Phycisphaerae bacterium]|jgi:glycine cleavage system transcriptional repressor